MTEQPETPFHIAEMARRHPLPEWPAHLPAPTFTFGISECGEDLHDMWLNSGERKVYLQARRDQQGHWYDDINDDPDWSDEIQEVRDAALAYARVVLDRYVETVGDAWGSEEGRAFRALVAARTFATGITETPHRP